MGHINKLVGTLVGKHTGPVLVVGGAPGMPEELASLIERGFDIDECIIISANEHAIHAGLKPHFACVNDDIHSMLQVHQEPRMRELMPGTQLLSRHWWADYRSPQLMACNSGLKALMYAAILGANPIVVIGIQNYSNGLYFHAAEGRRSNPNLEREASYFTKQTTALRKALDGVSVRTVSGPLTHIWPKWDPKEVFLPRGKVQLEHKAQADAATGRYVCTTTEAVAFEGALIPEGMIFAVTRAELSAWGHSDSVVDATGWDLRNAESRLAQTYEHRRAEQERLRRLIGKVRASRRGISRSIYDADIVRIIKWAEQGLTPVGIAGKIGLPKEQIQFMVQTMGLTVGARRPTLEPAIDTSARGLTSVPGDPGALPP